MATNYKGAFWRMVLPVDLSTSSLFIITNPHNSKRQVLIAHLIDEKTGVQRTYITHPD